MNTKQASTTGLQIKVNELVFKLNTDINCTDPNMFKMYCQSIVKNDFTGRRAAELCDIERNHQLRMYRTIIHNFGKESYIDLVCDDRLSVQP